MGLGRPRGGGEIGVGYRCGVWGDRGGDGKDRVVVER